jgi:hypothetical protein
MTERYIPESAVRELFDAMRHDPAHHLGLGDIRLTIGQQEDLLATAAPQDEAPEPGLPWVSVEDGLPADGFTVLAVPASGGDPIDDFRDDGKWAFAEGEGETVTHWLPLSALPLPGDEAKPAPEPEGVRYACDECGDEAWSRLAGPIRCHAPACGMRVLAAPQTRAQEEIAMSDARESRSEAIVEALLADLADRAGMGMNEFDDEITVNMRESWKRAILDAMPEDEGWIDAGEVVIKQQSATVRTVAAAGRNRPGMIEPGTYHVKIKPVEGEE